MDLNKQFGGGKWLKAAHIERPTTLTIDKIYNEKVGREREVRPVVYFEGEDRGLILNKTNGRALCDICGTSDTQKMSGQQVELYVVDTEYQGDPIKGLRLREPDLQDDDLDRVVG